MNFMRSCIAHQSTQVSFIEWYSITYGDLDHRLVVICFTVLSDMPVLWRTCYSVDLYVMLLSRAFASVLLTTSYKQPITRMYHGEGRFGLFVRLFHCRRYV